MARRADDPIPIERRPRAARRSFLMADPASGRCWLFYYPSLTSLLVLLRPVDKPNFNILDPQGPVPRKLGTSVPVYNILD